jgi:hypothetical protein
MTKTTQNKPEYAWDNPDIPHKGWTEECVTDLETPQHTCEMCGKTDIRYVHTMSHPEYHDLDVGCECAINMTDDYVGPKETRRRATNLSKNKQTWFAKSAWADYTAVRIPASYRQSRSILTSVKQAKNNVWTWEVYADNGESKIGFAYSRDDAKQRTEQYVKTMKTTRE